MSPNACANCDCAEPKTVLPIHRVIRIGLSGNPNSGKTTLFNALTGAHQKVGNYAGVTVEKKEGVCHVEGCEFRFFDLPGTYSLTAYSLDEVVTRDFILEEKPDVLVDVIDSTNLERNLFLLTQFQELGIPVIGALNLIDESEESGISIDEKSLGSILGIPLIKTSGKRGRGLNELKSAILAAMRETRKEPRQIHYGEEVEIEIEHLELSLKNDPEFAARYPLRWIAVKLLEKDGGVMEKLASHATRSEVVQEAEKSIRRLERHFGRDAEIVLTEQRYAYVHGAVTETVIKSVKPRYEMTQKMDSLLLNRIIGFPIFLFIMWSIFQITFHVGEIPMGWLEILFGWLSQLAETTISEGFVRSMVVDGIIGGVGGVLSFVPLIIILFTCIAFLEDTGYMARAAFLMDKFLHFFGLHGQSFLPMMVGFGCSVPAIMAARTLKNQRDRIITILITPFMSCGAKLPVYVLLAGAFFPDQAGNIIMAVYLAGILLGLLSAKLFRKTILAGEATPFVMELPPYRMPTWRGVGWHVWYKTSRYLKKAGTVLLAASMIIWALTAFPRAGEGMTEHDQLYNSYAGKIGRFIEPVVQPIGFDWKIGISVVTGFAAKEAVVSTLGVLYKSGAETNEESPSLREALRRDPIFNPVVALILMLFTLIAPPCIAALSALNAEAGKKWFLFGIFYSISISWGLGFIIHTVDKWLK